MSNSVHWRTLREALARRQDAGSAVRLWLRDDDAVVPTAALDRLLRLTGQFAIHVAIAAIPAQSGEALAKHMTDYRHATVVVHGWNHANHAAPGQKKQELGGPRPAAEVLGELAAALRRMKGLHGEKFFPMLVPPWNRIAADLVPHLPGLGFASLSCFGATRFDAPIPVVNTHVDLIDWRGTRGGRDHAALTHDLVEQLRRTEQTGEPLGILAHHLVHDEAAWSFLEELFALTASIAGCHWQSAENLASRLGFQSPLPL